MGTVGLSFGSPTSGAGFDVSSTVAEIVGNLQNVETPWKNQLTTLESQDTVISNLGTLFSNLSNDLSSLTDFEGILAEKEGSSSDTSVLELTAATSSAAAGTYAVVVNLLATTANGYLDPITDSSDTLTGSITINGTTVDVPASSTGDNNLSGLASAINSADLGVTASVTTDANGSRLSLVSNSSGASGSLSVTSAIDDGSTALNYNSNLATGANASLSVNGVAYSFASNTVSNLIPGVTFQLLGTSSSGSEVQVVITNDNSDVESTVNQFVTDYNSLISAINTQDGNNSSGTPEPLFGSPTLTLLQQQLLNGLNLQNPNGSLDPTSTDTNTTISGSITIHVGDGTPQTVNVGDSSTPDTLAGLAQAINSANIGVTAGVITSSGQSTLSLLSQTAGSAGALTVGSEIVATGYTPLSYSGVAGTSTVTSTGTLTSIPSAGDLLTGSISIQVSGGAAQTVTVPTANNTLQGLADAINNTSGIGVTASVVTNGDGSSSLSLLSQTPGSAGTLSVNSSIMDTTSLTSSTLDYTNSSDISTLANLGITISDKDDGSLDYDANTLDAVLNSDYSGVVGFFQNVNSWGQTFANMLTNAGTSSSTGILALASSSNSSIESTLNAEISNENSLISAEQSSLTTELNQANEIMQELPSELNGINELYSAITGYDQNMNG